MTSVIHKGLSGFGFKDCGDQLIKWTTGKESKLVLMESCQAQMIERRLMKLYPLHTVPVYSKKEDGESFEFSMPKLDFPSGFTFKYNPREIRSLIRQSFENRSWEPKAGFKSIVRKELAKYPLSDLKLMAEAALEYCSDIYPHGYAHGDMGFANMLVDDKKIQIYMIDFTKSFIQSPLIDLATMELSLFSEFTKSWSLECWTDCSNALFRYKEQANVVRMVKVISFLRDNDSSERHKELTGLFYGWADRRRSVQRALRK